MLTTIWLFLKEISRAINFNVKHAKFVSNSNYIFHTRFRSDKFTGEFDGINIVLAFTISNNQFNVQENNEPIV